MMWTNWILNYRIMKMVGWVWVLDRKGWKESSSVSVIYYPPCYLAWFFSIRRRWDRQAARQRTCYYRATSKGNAQPSSWTMRLQSFAFNHWISKSKSGFFQNIVVLSARLHACHHIYNVRAHYKRDVCLSTTCKKKTMTEMPGSLLKYRCIGLFALRMRYSLQKDAFSRPVSIYQL